MGCSVSHQLRVRALEEPVELGRMRGGIAREAERGRRRRSSCCSRSTHAPRMCLRQSTLGLRLCITVGLSRPGANARPSSHPD